MNKMKKIKICIIEDSQMAYQTRLPKHYLKGEEFYMIDESKMDWIDRIETESDKVQEFLESLVEKRDKKRKQERSKI